MEKGLSIHEVPIADLLPRLKHLESSKTDTTAGAASIEEMLDGAIGYLVKLGDVPVLAYAMRIARHERRAVAWVLAAAGSAPGIDLTRDVMPSIEAQARALGAAQVALTTRRAGLMAKLKEQGFEQTGVTLRKNL